MATALVGISRSEMAYERFVEALAIGTEETLLTANVVRAAAWAINHGFPNTAKLALEEIAARFERGEM